MSAKGARSARTVTSLWSHGRRLTFGSAGLPQILQHRIHKAHPRQYSNPYLRVYPFYVWPLEVEPALTNEGRA